MKIYGPGYLNCRNKDLRKTKKEKKTERIMFLLLSPDFLIFIFSSLIGHKWIQRTTCILLVSLTTLSQELYTATRCLGSVKEQILHHSKLIHFIYIYIYIYIYTYIHTHTHTHTHTLMWVKSTVRPTQAFFP